jgi:hypothetical protein
MLARRASWERGSGDRGGGVPQSSEQLGLSGSMGFGVFTTADGVGGVAYAPVGTVYTHTGVHKGVVNNARYYYKTTNSSPMGHGENTGTRECIKSNQDWSTILCKNNLSGGGQCVVDLLEAFRWALSSSPSSLRRQLRQQQQQRSSRRAKGHQVVSIGEFVDQSLILS